MKEQLRLAIRKKGVLALTMLDGWLAWAQRCRIPAFVELGRKISKNIAGIEAAMLNNLSNALIESTNTKIRVLHRMAFGFAKPEHLIALALLDRGGYCPPLPGRVSVRGLAPSETSSVNVDADADCSKSVLDEGWFPEA